MSAHHQETSTMESEEDDTRDFSLSYSQTTNPGPSSPASSHSNHNDADQSYESSESEFSNRLLSRPLQMHSYTTRVALSALIDHQIIVVEYGSQAQYRYGYEEVLILVEWAVPDDQLQRASQVLIEAEFPRVDHGERQERLGCWGLQSLPHDLDGSTRGRIHLLPLSLTGLTLEETVEVPSTFAPKLYLRTPKPPRYFLSLLKSLLKLRIGDRSRNRVIKDLKCFISHYILFAPPADTPGEVLDEIMAKETDEEYAIRSDGSIRDVLAWDWGDGGIEERDLVMVERALRELHYIDTLTDVGPPLREPSPIWQTASDTNVEESVEESVEGYVNDGFLW